MLTKGEDVFYCSGCDTKSNDTKAVGRVTLVVEDNGTEFHMWTKVPLVEWLVSRPGEEWGEIDSPERNMVKHQLDEHVGHRYRARIQIQNCKLYCTKLRRVDEQSKKRRT